MVWMAFSLGLCEVPLLVLTFCGLMLMSYGLRHGAA
jgi:hypothetical protein